jgi:hypothetical protein
MTDITDVVQTKNHESAEAELTNAASIAVQRIIQKYTLEAVWPSKDPAVVKSLIMRMASDMARLFGRKVEDVSLEDLARAQAKIQKICGMGHLSLPLRCINRLRRSSTSCRTYIG